MRVRACTGQTSGARCSELIKGFIPLPRSSPIATRGHCLHTNVALGKLFISITVLEGGWGGR